MSFAKSLAAAAGSCDEPPIAHHGAREEDLPTVTVRVRLRHADAVVLFDWLTITDLNAVPITHPAQKQALADLLSRFGRVADTEIAETKVALRAGERGPMWQENDYVFVTRTGWPVEGRNLYRSFTRIAKDAGIHVVRPHDARHGFATLMADSGLEPRLLMELTGHSEIGVTMNVHTYVVQKPKPEAIKIIDRLLRPVRTRDTRLGAPECSKIV